VCFVPVCRVSDCPVFLFIHYLHKDVERSNSFVCFVVLLTATRTRCVGCQNLQCVLFSHHLHKACRVLKGS